MVVRRVTTPEKTVVLAVDDNTDALYALAQVLEHNGYQPVTTSDAGSAIELARECKPSIILLDVVMPNVTGYQLTKQLKADPALRYIPIILLTAKDTLAEIVFGLDQGADDYVIKPYDQELLLARLRAALRLAALYQELRTTQQQNSNLLTQLTDQMGVEQIVGESTRMKEVFSLIDKLSKSDSSVLISGASGTGKELVARAMHFRSNRRENPFVARNCAAFAETLLESELFGYQRGAFTGAQRDTPGVFEAADGGTLFLDEVGEMSQALQAKLLRVLQDGVVVPVGSNTPKQVEVRVLAATNRDLLQMVEAGKFREDLYYRLNVINVTLPSLTERREDIPLLIEHFLLRGGERRGERRKSIAPEAVELLSGYSWRGNVRELQNEIERMLILGSDQEILGPDLVSTRIREAATAGEGGVENLSPLKKAVEELERQMVIDALNRTGGNKSLAARELGISRGNLISKVQQYQLESVGKWTPEKGLSDKGHTGKEPTGR